MALAAVQTDTTDAADIRVDDHRVWSDHHPEGTFENEDRDKSVEYWLSFLLSEVATLNEYLIEQAECIERLERRLDAMLAVGC